MSLRSASVFLLLAAFLFVGADAFGSSPVDRNVTLSSPTEADSIFHTDSGVAEFTSVAPMLEFTGTSHHLTGLIDLRRNTLDFYLDLETLDTGIRLRNKHMRDSYLETDLHPFAEFKGRLAAVPKLEPDTPVAVRASGRFNLHGVDRDIEVEGTLELRNGDLHLEAGWDLRLQDYGIDVPKVVFYELSEVQKIRLKGIFTPYSYPN